MRNFQISEQNLQQIFNILGECPAKYIFSVLELLKNLEEILPEKKDVKDEV